MRWIAAATCFLVLVALAVAVFEPRPEGTLGVTLGGGTHALVTAIDPGSPLGRAGMHVGDIVRFDEMPRAAIDAVTEPIAGLPVTIVAERLQRQFTVRATPTTLPSPWRSWSFVLRWLLTLLYAAIALLVAWRAQSNVLRTLITLALCSLANGWVCENIVLKLTLPAVVALLDALLWLCVSVLLISVTLFAFSYPPRTSVAHGRFAIAGVSYVILAVVALVMYQTDAIYHFLPFDIAGIAYPLEIGLALIIAAAVIEGLVNADTAHRVPAIVAGSTLLTLAAFNATDYLRDLFSWNIPWLSSFEWLQWASGFGMAYAVLRHRLVDLNVVISRAAIFSSVSLSLIAIFVLAEWSLATVFERALGPTFGQGDELTLTAIIALGVGLSARGVHQVIDVRLNRLFFARRYRALADLRRFALETDAAADAGALLELTLTILRRSLDAQYVAIYTGAPKFGYGSVGPIGSPLPMRFGEDDELVLRLRRWGEAFTVESDAHPLVGAYLSPMMLRGTLYGFTICGPKHDRTKYLPDECTGISTVAHRVGIAYEWLTRNASLKSPIDVR